MKTEQLQEALEGVLKNERVVKSLAKSLLAELITVKNNPTSEEDKAIKAHVVFAEEGNESGHWSTAGEILEHVKKTSGVKEFSTRVFGKSLAKFSNEIKQSSKGKVYFVRDIVKDATAYVEPIKEEVKEQEESKKPKKEKRSKEEEYTKNLKPATPEEAFEAPEVAFEDLLKMVDGFEKKADFAEFLESKSEKGLIKLIRKHNLPEKITNLDIKEMTLAILSYFPEDDEKPKETEMPSEKDLDSVSSGKKDKKSKKEKKSKKDKKDKKKKKS